MELFFLFFLYSTCTSRLIPPAMDIFQSALVTSIFNNQDTLIHLRFMSHFVKRRAVGVCDHAGPISVSMTVTVRSRRYITASVTTDLNSYLKLMLFPDLLIVVIKSICC